MQFLGTFPRLAPTRTLDGLYGVDEYFEDHQIVQVCRTDDYGERNPVSAQTRWRFVPFFPLYLGLAPVFASPFGGDARRIYGDTFTLYLVGLSEALE
jgi:hypothetical protein